MYDNFLIFNFSLYFITRYFFIKIIIIEFWIELLSFEFWRIFLFLVIENFSRRISKIQIFLVSDKLYRNRLLLMIENLAVVSSSCGSHISFQLIFEGDNDSRLRRVH